jgi:hypothetical protein
MIRVFLILIVVFLTGCGTTRINYETKKISLEDAYNVIDQMVMTQHREWKPDTFVITDNYLGWGYGSVSNNTSTGVIYNNALLGASSSTIRNIGERIYFNKIEGLQLLDWTRKFKQWYVVILVGKDGKVIKHILRTRSISEAQLMMDSMTILLKDRKLNG